MFRPQDGAGGDGVHPHLRSEFTREGFGEHDEASLGGAVDGIIFQRSLRVHIRHVDDATVTALEIGCHRLGEKERRLQIGPQQIVPLLLRRLAHGGGIKTRGIVEQHIQATEGLGRTLRQNFQMAIVE